MSKAPLICLSVALLGITSCVEICALATGSLDGCIPGKGTQDDLNPPISPDDGEPTAELRVMLSASRTTPAVNEEVELTCVLVEGDPTGVTFQFQPPDGRLAVDNQAGTASFIVTAADVGDQPEFTCTATDEETTSPPSNRVVIEPIG